MFFEKNGKIVDQKGNLVEDLSFMAILSKPDASIYRIGSYQDLKKFKERYKNITHNFGGLLIVNLSKMKLTAQQQVELANKIHHKEFQVLINKTLNGIITHNEELIYNSLKKILEN